ncbi:MAG: hypothetical protein MZV70_12725 [Desulfobacterales bacterium]|nr:hypothetical protein [Desulfobacterales bacterium]
MRIFDIFVTTIVGFMRPGHAHRGHFHRQPGVTALLGLAKVSDVLRVSATARSG